MKVIKYAFDIGEEGTVLKYNDRVTSMYWKSIWGKDEFEKSVKVGL